MSLWDLYLGTVIPRALFKTNTTDSMSTKRVGARRPAVFVANMGGLRFNLYAG
jgi:hypothetical protein